MGMAKKRTKIKTPSSGRFVRYAGKLAYELQGSTGGGFFATTKNNSRRDLLKYV